ncbi:MAG TPA: aminotransferase class I/II-fold pyridoxal phosphate-dependent enzyme [Candidatus Poseidoniales archaeon]|nr:aminotransferase class I/II-fold pyridoxal phosphate-dependent enzyme [Candidatus Poseidoniales archaeon]
MDKRLSQMANSMERSQILAIAAEVRTMIADGKQVTPYTIGDFSPEHFEVPPRFIELMHEALDDGQTNYPPAAGLPELRCALADWMKHRFGLDVGAEGIIVGSGARPVLYAAFRLFLEAGDGLAHGVPAWNNHYYVHLNDAVDISLVGTVESRFLPTAAQLKERIAETRVLVLNSPLNPTGTCFTKEELGAICDVILEENARRDGKPVMLIYDQVYSTMTAPGIEHVHPVQVRPEMFEYTVTLDAVSKSLTGTGLRLGWMALPPSLAAPVIALIGHMGAWPARPIQKAAAGVYSDFELLENYFDGLDEKIAARMEILKTKLSKMHPMIEIVQPQGGIYLTVRFNLFEKIGATSNEEIRQWLLNEAGVAVVPFQAFGLEDESGWFRISIGAVGLEDVVASMDRLEAALNC